MTDDITTHAEVIEMIKAQYSYDEFCEKVFEEFEDELGNLEGVKARFELNE